MSKSIVNVEIQEIHIEERACILPHVIFLHPKNSAFISGTYRLRTLGYRCNTKNNRLSS